MLVRKIVVLLLLVIVGSLIASTTIPAVDEAFARGEISQDELILNKIYAIFEPQKMDERFRIDAPAVFKCATPILIEYENMRAGLAESTIEIVDGYLEVNRELRSIYDSPSGHFRLNYSTTGGNAVPAGDTDASGVPDFVEWAGDYLDYTWDRQVTSANFAGPNHSGGDGFYNVSFENMGSYGYCTTGGVDGGELTRLVLNNNFLGFGANQDPDGNVKGAMKVTCAHEFKHASQRVHSGWSESGYWNELDAAWAEEFVFDYVNDSMLNFMGYGDPYSHPHWGLDHGGSASYEDYPWEDFVHQRFGGNSYDFAPVILDYWIWRETHTGQSVMASYVQMLTNAGSSLVDAFGEYVVWNFFTGSRAVMNAGVSQFGYDEAGIAGFPTATLANTYNSYPVSGSVSGIENLGAKMIRLNPGGEEGLEIIFDGQNSVTMSAMWAVRYEDFSVEWGSIELDANNDGSVVLDIRDAVMAALIPVIPQVSGSTYGASYTIEAYSWTECDAGDLNDDGVQDVSDLVRLVAVILGNGDEPNDIELCAGDVNGDDQTNVQDVVTLVDIILH
ncbi:hypothetical protein HQ531_03020 [bacterium]|nr:hypothetical protein [bacterium]